MITKCVYRLLFVLLLLVFYVQSRSSDFSDNSFLIAEINANNANNNRLWSFIKSNSWTGIEIKLDSIEGRIVLHNTNQTFISILENLKTILNSDNSRIIPVFVRYKNNVEILDSIITGSPVFPQIFYSPQGEAWPTTEYLVQSNRRIIFFIEGKYANESRVLHRLDNYALQISASEITPNSKILSQNSNINSELFKVDHFDQLPTAAPVSRLSRNMVPDYVNFLLENWKKYGKKPNFIFVGKNILNFDFIIDQLNSFTRIKGKVRTGAKNLEKVYWKNPDVLITGGRFSFPFRGGEEIILSPFAPGFNLSPEQIIVTTEMVLPEQFLLVATPLKLSEDLEASFNFDEVILDEVHPTLSFKGENFSFTQDIERGQVLKLPENGNVNLGDPELYGLPNSSFTVTCFVKFNEILEMGDNAILGNYEQGYRRGMHLILRSGHPYFGLWANDFMSEEILEPNIWYHLAWRYIIETGEQSIFLNGKYIGGSDGHPPYSGTSDLHLGSAFSKGASLHGYVDNLRIWTRPLGNEEINRVSLDEEIILREEKSDRTILSNENFQLYISIFAFILLLIILGFIFRFFRKKKTENTEIEARPNENLICLFGEFQAVNSNSENISKLFTPKIKELFIYILVHTLKSGIGAKTNEVNETLWDGLEPKKIANNRSVTLNKLRKLLSEFDEIEIVSQGGYLQLKPGASFYCDYIEAYNLCRSAKSLTRPQLETFFRIVKRGSFLKGIFWPWLDDVRGFMGNQVIDNLLKLASIYKKENKAQEVEKIAQRILEYDDLNEEATYLQIWSLQQGNNTHLAKYNFGAFCKRFEKSFGEEYAMNYREFTLHFHNRL